MQEENGVSDKSFGHSKPRRRWLIITFGLVFLIVIIATIVVYWLRIYSSTPIPKNIQKQLNYQAYYPTKLPNSYSIDKKSFKIPEQNIITYDIKNTNGKNIAVSEQPLPKDLNLDAKRNAPPGVRLPEDKQFITAIGQAKIEMWGDKLVCHIVTPQTWIIMNITNISRDDAVSIAQSFIN